MYNGCYRYQGLQLPRMQENERVPLGVSKKWSIFRVTGKHFLKTGARVAVYKIYSQRRISLGFSGFGIGAAIIASRSSSSISSYLFSITASS